MSEKLKKEKKLKEQHEYRYIRKSPRNHYLYNNLKLNIMENKKNAYKILELQNFIFKNEKVYKHLLKIEDLKAKINDEVFKNIHFDDGDEVSLDMWEKDIKELSYILTKRTKKFINYFSSDCFKNLIKDKGFRFFWVEQLLAIKNI